MGTRSKRFLDIPDEFWIGFVFLVSFMLKLIYDIQVGYSAPTVNAGVWKLMENGVPNEGHVGYIQYLFTCHRYPDVDPRGYACFIDPPFFYVICALILEVIHRMMTWPIGTCLHVLQCINVIYVTIGCSHMISMVHKFGIRGRKLVVCILFISFFPGFYHLSSELTPNAMSFMFSMGALNHGLSWYRSRRQKSFLTAATLLGMGLLTAWQAILVVPALLVLYNYAIKDGRRNEISLGRQMRTALMILIPCGIAWPLYRWIRFRIPFFYAQKSLRPYGSVAEWSVFSRIRIPGRGLFTDLHTMGVPAREYNIWAQTLKTAIFNFQSISFSRGEARVFSEFTFRVSLLLCVLFHVMWIYTMFTARLEQPLKRFLQIGYLSYLIMYVISCLRFPYIYYMNFMRIAPILIFPVIGMGVCGYGSSEDTIFEKVTSWAANGLTLVFALVTAFVFGFYA
ncbi:MAG: hypothetical protein VZR02_03720 [Lachnospiraceae bacterium]|nr:hypothetical protein [Lachnospiraceae bacterium]